LCLLFDPLELSAQWTQQEKENGKWFDAHMQVCGGWERAGYNEQHEVISLAEINCCTKRCNCDHRPPGTLYFRLAKHIFKAGKPYAAW
jgi:hypothetical protein